MKTFDQFFPFLLPYVPGCSEPAAETALLQATRMFCDKTRAWSKVLDDALLIVGIDEYDIELPANTELVRIEAAKVNGQDIRVRMPNEQIGLTQRFIECHDGQTVFLNPKPSANGTMSLTATLKPALTASSVEDFLFDRYAELIAQGATSILQAQPLKSYSNPRDAQTTRADFEDQCVTVRNRLWRGLGRNTPRVRPNFF